LLRETLILDLEWLNMKQYAKHTIEEMQSLAAAKAGRCLSDNYVNALTKLKWECVQGHKWEAKPNDIQRGHWCLKCAGKEKKTIEEMQVLAAARGGRCLSKSYINRSTRLRWECVEGHQWLAQPGDIQQGHWCPECAGRAKKTIEDMQALAAAKSGRCLSNIYVNNKTKLRWECELDHRWFATPNDIQQGGWCHRCANKKSGDQRRKTIEEMQVLAAARGGRCLSKRYINGSTRLRWECVEGHRWLAIPYSIDQGRWCPECSNGISERIARVHFEQIFGRSFPKSKPKWLVSSRNTRMELDGYCASLNLAFEYHGIQHFTFRKFFHRKANSLAKRKKDDQHKHNLCTIHGVKLIAIPYTIKIGEIKHFILQACAGLKIDIPANAHDIKIDIRPAASRRELSEMQELAKQKSGKCLSTRYFDSMSKLHWECEQGHRWFAVPHDIRRGHWCRKCANKITGDQQRNTIEEMQALAFKMSGRCLSAIFINMHSPLEWECAEGHRWFARPNHIQQGQWCRKCAYNRARSSNRKTIDHLQIS
jgi:hypothetical protein